MLSAIKAICAGRIHSTWILFGALVLTLTGCSGTPAPVAPPPVTTPPSSAHQLGDVSILNLAAFDIATADSKYVYLADISNKAIDVIDPALNELVAQVPGGFAGRGADSPHSSPKGVVTLPGTSLLYVGDVNSVKVVDISGKLPYATIAASNQGVSVDEGCYDPDDSLMMFALTDDTPVSAIFISTKTQTIVSRITFPVSSGLEACQYDSATKSFYFNNDGTPANPYGEMNVISAASVLANAPTVSQVFPFGSCSPKGLAFGPGTDVVVACNPFPPFTQQITLILNRMTGAILATIPVGGGDEIVYDPGSNRYFAADFFSQPKNVPGTFATATPMLHIIDASTRSLISGLPIPAVSHSITVSPVSNQVYVPNIAGANNSPASGVLTFTTH